jgi:hypothetical protein
MYVSYLNGTISSGIPLNESLAAGELKGFYVTGITQNFSKIIIKTHCPDISEEDDCK